MGAADFVSLVGLFFLIKVSDVALPCKHDSLWESSLVYGKLQHCGAWLKANVIAKSYH